MTPAERTAATVHALGGDWRARVASHRATHGSVEPPADIDTTRARALGELVALLARRAGVNPRDASDEQIAAWAEQASAIEYTSRGAR